MTPRRIPFASLVPAGDDADLVARAIARVVSSGWYVLGPEVEAFEAELAAACATQHAIGVGNGTDALYLILRATGIGHGDEVITSPLSAAYTALAIVMTGARPVFADVEAGRLTLDPAAADRAVTARTKAILPVHLYGQAADMAGIERVAARHNLAIVEDCCQAHLATAAGRPVGTIGRAGALSFYPTKNLGGLGDAGAVITNDAALAASVKQLRNGGQTSRYRHETLGVNSRLDELQAAILRARLPLLLRSTAERRRLAGLYRAQLGGMMLPEVDAGHVYHLCVVRTTARDRLQRRLADAGIETLVHYPMPIPAQPAFSDFADGICPVAAQACDEVLSLPLNPSLPDDAIHAVVSGIAAAQELSSR